MRLVPIGDDEGVEVCDACGGALIDFFDGEPTRLARELVAHEKKDFSRRSKALVHCPDCEREMDSAVYLGSEGPSISRCGQCFAVFVTAAQLVALGKFRQLQKLSARPDWFERFVGALGDLFP